MENGFKDSMIIPEAPISDYAAALDDVPQSALERGRDFAEQIARNMISDFKRDGDFMVHVSSYVVMNGMIYVTYYANRDTAAEDPHYHTARFVFCRADNPDEKTYIDVQRAGDTWNGKSVDALYDTILMRNGSRLFIEWTAMLSGNYYRLYRVFDTETGELSDIRANMLKIGDTVVEFNIADMKRAFEAHGIGYKNMYSDIGIMQKLSYRDETDGMGNTVRYYYSGAYCGDCNFIIKSRDLAVWEYVSQPDFLNQSQWENAVYVIDERCFYFVRQRGSEYGFLTAYNLDSGTWDKPVLIPDCQSRSDFIIHDGDLYLFHAPIDRNHIGVVKICRDELARSEIVMQADMGESCFYPFIDYGDDGRLYFSYTSDRRHIKLSRFEWRL